jgi:nucleotide-binding universal stress UspA family protein
MNKFALKTVVVPWDFSPMSKSALSDALEIVESPDKIEVIHVTPYPVVSEYSMIWGAIPQTDIQDQLKSVFEQEMEKDGFPNLKFTVQFGDPGAVVAEFAKSKNAGLVVISSHGHTGLSRILLGSVAERVVRLSPCPVLVLRGSDSE